LGRTVRELEQSLGYDELLEWQAYFNLTHFGELRSDRRNADLLAMLYNINRPPRSPAKGSDHFMVYKVKRPELSGEQLHDKMEAVFNGL
jgi:hypothetical protein